MINQDAAVSSSIGGVVFSHTIKWSSLEQFLQWMSHCLSWLVYSELFQFSKNGGKILFCPVCEPSDLPDLMQCIPQPHSRYWCLNEPVSFPSSLSMLEARKLNAIWGFLVCFFLQAALLLSTEAVQAGAAALWMGSSSCWPWDVWCLAQRSQLWGVAVTGRRWSHSPTRKVWSQPVCWWSHFRDLLEQKDMTSCELQCINSSLTYCQVWGQRAKSHP